MAQQSFPTSRSSWLAITTGCCASRRDSIEDEREVQLHGEGQYKSELQICYDQPRSVPEPRAQPVSPSHATPPATRPTTSHSVGLQVSQWVSSSRDFATRASSRASLHSLSKPRRSHHKPRPNIGHPMNFQRVDSVDGIQSMLDDAPMPIRRRRSFRPLELSIYEEDGRLSPLPDFSEAQREWRNISATIEVPAQALIREHDSRTNSISSDPSTSAYLIQRKPVGSSSRRSSVQSTTSTRPVSATLSNLPFLHEDRSRPSSIASLSTSVLSPTRILSRLPSPSRSRSNSRPGSLRRAKTDIDEEIKALNTIVEERRADAYRTTNLSPAFINRPPPSPSHHVPTIAPSLRLRCRAETLSDIGSAFSKPLPAPPVPNVGVPARTGRLALAPLAYSFAPLSSNPVTPPDAAIPTPTTPIGRFGAWLKKSLPSSPTTIASRSKPVTPVNADTFYQLNASAPYGTGYELDSRPSTTASTLQNTTHTRQTSNETTTTTATLLSSYPSTPALSERSLSPTSYTTASRSPAFPHAEFLDLDEKTGTMPGNGEVLKGPGKTRRIPAPLVLNKDMDVEMAMPSGRSVRTVGGRLKPPMSPNYHILSGMERCVPGGVAGERVSVGVAF